MKQEKGRWMHGVFFTNPSLNPLESAGATNQWKDTLMHAPKQKNRK
jgi:hypothetical protein